MQLVKINLANAVRKEAPPAPVENPSMAKRKALSKRTRFEIFKRDGFKCFYCGATPQNAAMEVSELVLDHVKPVKEGGATAAHNLVTSCVPCNAGKSAVPLALRKYEPKVGEADREHHEQLEEYLAIQRAVADLKETFLDDLESDWDRLSGWRRPTNLRGHLRGLAKDYSIDDLRRGMEALNKARYLSGSPIAYFRGILKNLDKPWAPKKREPPPAPAPKATTDVPPGMAARIQRVTAAIQRAADDVSSGRMPAHRGTKVEMLAAFHAAVGDFYLPYPESEDWYEDAIENGQREFKAMDLKLAFEDVTDGRFRWAVRYDSGFQSDREVADATFSAAETLRSRIEVARQRGESPDLEKLLSEFFDEFVHFRNWEMNWGTEAYSSDTVAYVYKNPLRDEEGE